MIRDYDKADLQALKEIHRLSGFDYRFPDLEDPLFVARKTVEENGRAVQGIAVKLEGTVYLWIAHDWGTPEERWQRMQELVEAAKLAAWEKGLDTLTCVVPPEIAESFEKRLKQIGMERDRPWVKFSFDLTTYHPAPRVESEAVCVSH
jgi:hypothetical protein